MNIEKIHIWMGLVANICVVAGILFLGIELSQNSRMVAAQTRTSITSEILYLAQLETSRDFQTAILKFENEEELNSLDENAISNIITQRLRHWENVYYQYENGLFDESEFSGIMAFMDSMVDSPYVRELWVEQRPFYSPNFQELIDTMID